jgi:integrase
VPAKTEKKLSDKEIAKATLATDGQWLNDGGGLYVRIHAGGDKTFYFRYRHPRTARLEWIKVGRYPDTSLKEARAKAVDLRKIKSTGMSPREDEENRHREIEATLREREEADRQVRMQITVAGLFEEWFDAQIKGEFKSADWLKNDVFASALAYELKPDGQTAVAFRDLPAKSVERGHIIAVIEATQRRGANSLANKQLRYLERMFDYGLSKGHLDASPFALIRKKAIRKRELSRARALTRDELRQVLTTLADMRASWQVQGVIMMAICTGQRTGYVCQLEWGEIVDNEWRIPPEKQTKESRRKVAPTTHTVYLPRQAVDLLEKIRHITGGKKFVFASERGEGNAPIAQATVEQSIGRHLRVMPGQGFRSGAYRPFTKKSEELTPFWTMPHWNAHDLRRTFATRMAEDVGTLPHVIERILNHAPANELAAIYNQATYERERKEAAKRWGDYLTSLSGANVLAGKFRKTSNASA